MSYETALICLIGHIITIGLESRPEMYAKYCVRWVLSSWYYLLSSCPDDVVHNFNLSKYFVIEALHPLLAKACLSRDPKRLK
jgi:hypothetical protein